MSHHREPNQNEARRKQETKDQFGEMAVEDEPTDAADAIRIMFKHHMPENRQALRESHINLDKIADYCHDNYFQVPAAAKDQALVITKNYAQQALASVASQIFTYADNLQTAMNLFENHLDSMDAKTRYIAARFRLHDEKRSRREIGLLTKPKRMPVGGERPPPVAYPDRSKLRSGNTGRYLGHESIDYTSLDHIGVAHKQRDRRMQPAIAMNRSAAAMLGATKSATLRPSKSSNLSSILPASEGGSSSSSTANMHVRPNTPPSAGTNVSGSGGHLMMFGTLTRTQKDYHRGGVGIGHPLVVPPPQVPSDYASLQPPQSAQIAKPESKPEPNSGGGGGSVQESPPLPPPPLESGPPGQESSSNSTTPVNYIEKVVAIYDYTADKDDELSFQENSVIYVVRKNDDGWWEGVLNGITGLFPGNYVEPCL